MNSLDINKHITPRAILGAVGLRMQGQYPVYDKNNILLDNDIANVSSQSSFGFSILLYANNFDLHFGGRNLPNSFIQPIIKESKREIEDNI